MKIKIKKYYKVALLMIIVLLAILNMGFVDDNEISDDELLNCKFYNKKAFYDSVNYAKENKIKLDDDSISNLFGGITPHHLLANNMIAQFFQVFEDKKPDTIVVIGPNHDAVGDVTLQTCNYDWNTPFGILKSNQDIIDKLIDKDLVLQNPSLLMNDHAISALVPYISYYMPDSKIVPILIKSNKNIEVSDKLVDFIYDNLKDENIIVIASVDFSHYLFPDISEKKDNESIKFIKNKDYNKLLDCNNDYMDSPLSIITFLKLAELNKANKMDILKHSNSCKIVNEYTDDNTSYFTILFSKLLINTYKN